MLACGRSPRKIVFAAIVFKVALLWFCLGLAVQACLVKGMPAVMSTMKKKAQPQQVVQRMKEAQSEALKLQHVLKSHFPAGVHDSLWTGTADEVGEKHEKFLETWFVVAARVSKDEERKAVLKAFPKCPQLC